MKRNKNLNKDSFYVNNDELDQEIIRSKEQDRITDELAEMFVKMVEGVSRKFPNLAYYGVIDDCKHDAILLLCEKYKMLDPTLGKSCFSYITTIITNSLRQGFLKEKSRKIKHNEMLDKVFDHLNSDSFIYEDHYPNQE